MKHENILRRIETEAGVANASRRDPGLYYTTIFGKPAAAAAWAWRFEGHHLSINVTSSRARRPWSRRCSSAPIRRACSRAQCRISVAGRGGRSRRVN